MRGRLPALLLAGALLTGVAACGDDDGAGVRVLDEGEGSASASGSASGVSSEEASASGVSTDETEH